MIADAINEKVAQIYVTLGGSATTDGGLGLLEALGAELMYQPAADAHNPLLTINYFSITAVQKLLSGIELLVLADVTNPYTGAEGFATTFDLRKVLYLKRYRYWSSKQKVAYFVQQEYQIDLNGIAGTGAAGGIGGATVLLGDRSVLDL